MIFQHHRVQIHNNNQHPYRHNLAELSYTHQATGGNVTNALQAVDWLFNVLYPKQQASVATPGDLPLVGNNIPDTRTVIDDGDGKSATYRWEQWEGEAGPSWHKIYDMDWGEQAVLSGFLDKTQDIYVHKRGYDDIDAAGDVIVGNLAGQRIYGGNSANTHLTLYANSGDLGGGNTGFIQMGDDVRPVTDATFDLGDPNFRFDKGFFTSTIYGLNFRSTYLSNQTDYNVNKIASTYTTYTIGSADKIVISDWLEVTNTATLDSTEYRALSLVSPTYLLDSVLTVTENTTLNKDLTVTLDANLNGPVKIPTIKSASGFIRSTFTDGTLGTFLVVNSDLAGNIELTKLVPVTADRALVSDASGVISTSAVTSTEVGYLSGVTSSVQTQLDSKATKDLSNVSSTAVSSSLIPGVTGIHDLGSATLYWQNIYANRVYDSSSNFVTTDVLASFKEANTGATDGMTLFWDNTLQQWRPSIPDTEITHDTLGGLTTGDAHTQYVRNNGRGNSQNIYGSDSTGGADGQLYLYGGPGTYSSVHVKNQIWTYGGLIPDGITVGPEDQSTQDIGGSMRRYRNIYMRGYISGFRLESLNEGVEAASASKAGRLIFNNSSKDIFVDEGGTWRRVGVERFSQTDGNTTWDGVLKTLTYNTSATIDDARDAIFNFVNITENYEQYFPTITRTQTSVTVTFDIAPPAGEYKLMGIR